MRSMDDRRKPKPMPTRMTDTGVDRDRLAHLRDREYRRFAERTARSAALAARAVAHMPGGVPMAWMRGLYRTPPLYVDHGSGPCFVDVDGNRYLDFNLADLSMTMGYGPETIVAAVARAMARGAHFLLAVEDSVVVAEELARRVGLPFWQFTLSASGANAEVIRIARALTGRGRIVVFGGHYHGHLDETLVEPGAGGSAPALLGVSAQTARMTTIVPFNDPEALERALSAGDVALVLTEPALTNCNVVLPEPGYLAAVRDLTRRHGALLCYDEAHSFQFAFGGLMRVWELDADFQVLGKGLGTGVSFGLYGMTAEIGAAVERRLDIDVGPAGLATGGTTYASALAVAAARGALEQVLTPAGYERTAALGARLSDGLENAFRRRGLDWTAFLLGPRSGYCLSPALPRNYDEAEVSLDPELIDARRVFMANRGVWDAVASAGPQASFAHNAGHIDIYLETADAFLAEVCVA
jgi:glutamate-1-semialdehyde aminotransferase